MKRIVAILLVLVLALSVACTAKPENNGKSTPNTNNETKNNSETGKEEILSECSTHLKRLKKQSRLSQLPSEGKKISLRWHQFLPEVKRSGH